MTKVRKNRAVSRCLGLALACAAVAWGAAGAWGKKEAATARPEGMKLYPTRYYQLYTDLPAEKVLEARVRLTLMAQEYWARTKTFGGVIREAFEFDIFSKREDYLAAGAPAGSAGVYQGFGKHKGRLMAWAAGGDTWRIVQHEGFHQFIHMTMGGDIPVWVDEGLAEYFGVGIWTGDAFVLGVIPPERQKRIVAMIEGGKMMSIPDMMKLSHAEWNAALASRNYDQAWSMVHFLAHADKGKYQGAFSAFIRDVASGQPWEKVWVNYFGRDTNRFRQLYAAWWTQLPPHATADQYARATVHTLTSFLARGVRMKQSFKSGAEFLQAAREGKLALDPVKQAAYWLPDSLLSGALAKADALGDWSIETAGALKLVLTQKNGDKFIGTYTVADGRFVTAVAYVPARKAASKPLSASRPAPSPSPSR